MAHMLVHIPHIWSMYVYIYIYLIIYIYNLYSYIYIYSSWDTDPTLQNCGFKSLHQNCDRNQVGPPMMSGTKVTASGTLDDTRDAVPHGASNFHEHAPDAPCMEYYGIFTYIWVIIGVTVGKYSIDGASGM